MDDDEIDDSPLVVESSDLVPDTDADADDRDRIEKRTRELGFRPQKEVIHNFLLPYADQVRPPLNILGSGCCTAVEHMPYDRKVVGSNPTR